MGSMIERVAKALQDEGPIGCCNIDDDKALELARAAIEALRDPSPKMLKAACKSMSPDRRPTPERVSVKAKHVIRYRAMIDAALNEGADT